MEILICIKCGIKKGVEFFYKERRRGGYRMPCKACQSEASKQKRRQTSTWRPPSYAYLNEQHDKWLKVCKTCGELKGIEDFYTNGDKWGDGYKANCKPCSIAAHHQWEVTRTPPTHPYTDPEQQQECIECSVIKLVTEFNIHSNGTLRRKCRECCKNQQAEYYQNTKEEHQIRNRQWTEENKEHRKKYMSRYYQENIEAFTQSNRRRYQANAIRNREYARIYYQEHKAEIKDYHQKYIRDNLEEVRARRRRYLNHNPQVYRAAWHRRRVRLLNAGSFTAYEWRTLCEWFGNVCLCCGEALPLTVDHVIPVSKGGMNTIDNLQPLCGVITGNGCNQKKYTSHIDYRDPKKLKEFLLWLISQDEGG